MSTSMRRQEQSVYYDIMGRDTLTVSYGPELSVTVPAETIRVWKHFNEAGQVDTLKRWGDPDPSGVDVITTAWMYDTAGRVVVEIAPDTAADSTYYDAAGNAVTKVTRRNSRIASTYDALNRLVARNIPAVEDSSRSAGIQASSHDILPSSFPAYEIPEDEQLFWYDAMGLLATDSSWIRTVEGTDFTAHVYGIRHHYDLDGRQVALDIPAQLGTLGDTSITLDYDAAFGALTSVTDLENATYDIG